MVLAVEEADGKIDNGETKRPLMQVFLHTRLDGSDELLRYRTTDDFIHELESGTPRLRCYFKMHIAKLTMTTRLFLMPPVLLDRFASCFPISHPGRLGFYGDVVAVLKPLGRDP